MGAGTTASKQGSGDAGLGRSVGVETTPVEVAARQLVVAAKPPEFVVRVLVQDYGCTRPEAHVILAKVLRALT